MGKSWGRDAAMRLVGVGLLAGCYLTMRWLFQHIGRGPAGLAEYLAAAVGFLALSSGAVLATLGGHLFDRVAVSERWARLSDTRAGTR